MRVRGLFSWVLIVGIASSGCGLLKKKMAGGDDDDGGAGAADAATVTVSGTGASNEAAVTRYAKETPIASEEGVIARDGVQVKTAVGQGTIVATLNTGTPVLKVASYFSSGVLIVFDDPATPDDTKFLGWVSPAAFVSPTGAAVTATATLKPFDKPTIYVPPAKKDAGAVVVKPDAGAVVVKPDAGAQPAAVDAGAPAVKPDAGAAPTPTTPPANPAGGLAFPPPPNGQCPAPFQKLDGLCRRPCTNDAGCPRATKCVPARVPGHKYCSIS